jgi:hypothetical protein
MTEDDRERDEIDELVDWQMRQKPIDRSSWWENGFTYRITPLPLPDNPIQNT